jgi:hypothetical protein
MATPYSLVIAALKLAGHTAIAAACSQEHRQGLFASLLARIDKDAS